MYPAPIDEYFSPATVEEALKLVAERPGDAHFIAGGQSLMQAIKSRLVQPRCLIDLNNVAELREISVGGEGVRIGAMVRYRDIAADERLNGAYQAVRDAASTVGDRQVRNRGTIGGSLCWNYLAACMPPASIGVGAQIELVSSEGGSRSMAAEDFLGGPLETAREENEVLVAVTLPPAPQNAGSAYRKWGLLTDALPVIGIATRVELDGGGACSGARFAVGGLATGPRRSAAAEDALAGKTADDADGLGAAADAAAAEIETQSDMWAGAAYRKQLIRALGREVLTEAFARAGSGSRS